MVSVRRRGGGPLPSHGGGGTAPGSFSSRTNYRLREIPTFPGAHGTSNNSSLCARVIRWVLLAFIVSQLVSLGIKVARSPRGFGNGDGTLLLSGSLGLRGQPDPIEIVKVDHHVAPEEQKKGKDDVTDAQEPDEAHNEIESERDDGGDAGTHHDGADGVGGVEPDPPLKNGGDSDEEENADDRDKEEPKPIEPPASGEDEEEEGEEKSIEEVEIDSKGPSLKTGANDQAFVVDLVHERHHPGFRKSVQGLIAALGKVPSSAASTMSAAAQNAGLSAVDPSSVKSCEYVQLSTSRVLQRATCRGDDSNIANRQLYYYNPAPFARYWCDHEVPPGGAVAVTKNPECKQPFRVFRTQPTGSSASAGMPPIIVKAHDSLDPNPALEAVECDVPCQFQSNLPERGDRTVDGTSWKIVVNDADPFMDERAKVELTAYKTLEYYSTMSQRSSVPLSLYNFDLYSLRNRPALKWEEADNAATYVLDTHCATAGLRRQKWYAAMAANFVTRSYGQCEHNTDLQMGETTQTLEGRIALSKKNRIHLAFEASGEKDYVTSIVWESLLSGAVPAILGARNLQDILPPHSAILSSGFNSWDAFAQYVRSVSENKTLWDSYHAWRTNETALQQFEARFNYTRTHPSCRTCRWAHAKLHGLGWDHRQQVVRNNAIPRRLCVEEASLQLVVQPFQEEWSGLTSASPDTAASKCLDALVDVASTAIEVDGCKVTRSVSQHDGIVDMTVRSAESAAASATKDVVVRFRFKHAHDQDGLFFPNVHALVPTTRGALVSSGAIQDDRTKVSVLASWPTEVRNPSPGVLEIVVVKKGQRLHPDEQLRIRVIAEDTSEIHDKRTEYFPSTFARQMTIDFVDAIELYYTET